MMGRRYSYPETTLQKQQRGYQNDTMTSKGQFQKFCNIQRSKMATRFPFLSSNQIIMKVKKMWRGMSPEKRRTLSEINVLRSPFIKKKAFPGNQRVTRIVHKEDETKGNEILDVGNTLMDKVKHTDVTESSVDRTPRLLNTTTNNGCKMNLPVIPPLDATTTPRRRSVRIANLCSTPPANTSLVERHLISANVLKHNKKNSRKSSGNQIKYPNTPSSQIKLRKRALPQDVLEEYEFKDDNMTTIKDLSNDKRALNGVNHMSTFGICVDEVVGKDTDNALQTTDNLIERIQNWMSSADVNGKEKIKDGLDSCKKSDSVYDFDEIETQEHCQSENKETEVCKELSKGTPNESAKDADGIHTKKLKSSIKESMNKKRKNRLSLTEAKKTNETPPVPHKEKRGKIPKNLKQKENKHVGKVSSENVNSKRKRPKLNTPPSQLRRSGRLSQRVSETKDKKKHAIYIDDSLQDSQEHTKNFNHPHHPLTPQRAETQEPVFTPIRTYVGRIDKPSKQRKVTYPINDNEDEEELPFALEDIGRLDSSCSSDDERFIITREQMYEEIVESDTSSGEFVINKTVSKNISEDSEIVQSKEKVSEKQCDQNHIHQARLASPQLETHNLYDQHPDEQIEEDDLEDSPESPNSTFHSSGTHPFNVSRSGRDICEEFSAYCSQLTASQESQNSVASMVSSLSSSLSVLVDEDEPTPNVSSFHGIGSDYERAEIADHAMQDLPLYYSSHGSPFETEVSGFVRSNIVTDENNTIANDILPEQETTFTAKASSLSDYNNKDVLSENPPTERKSNRTNTREVITRGTRKGNSSSRRDVRGKENGAPNGNVVTIKRKPSGKFGQGEEQEHHKAIETPKQKPKRAVTLCDDSSALDSTEQGSEGQGEVEREEHPKTADTAEQKDDGELCDMFKQVTPGQVRRGLLATTRRMFTSNHGKSETHIADMLRDPDGNIFL